MKLHDSVIRKYVEDHELARIQFTRDNPGCLMQDAINAGIKAGLESFASANLQSIQEMLSYSGYMLIYKYWDGWALHAQCQTGHQNGPMMVKFSEMQNIKCTKCCLPMLTEEETQS